VKNKIFGTELKINFGNFTRNFFTLQKLL